MRTRGIIIEINYLFGFDVFCVKMPPFDELSARDSNAFNPVLMRANISFEESVLFQQVLHAGQILKKSSFTNKYLLGST